MTARFSLLLLLPLLGFLNACLRYETIPRGPDAFAYWSSQYAKQKGCTGLITSAERARISEDVDNRLNRYLASHPEFSDAKKKQFRGRYGNITVQPGMTKEDVRGLVDAPAEILTSPDKLSGVAKDEWGETQEAWIYYLGGLLCHDDTYIVYFRSDTVTHIVKSLPITWGILG